MSHGCCRLKAAKVTDNRVRVMNEIISGMRLIKMYAWEWAFHEYVKKIRKFVFIVLTLLLSISVCVVCMYVCVGRRVGSLLKPV